MGFDNPGRMDIFVHSYIAPLLVGHLYKRFVEGMGLNGGERVLDYGSGPGSEARFIAPILEKGGGRLTCVDVSSAWIDVVKKKLRNYLNVDSKLGEISSLGIEDGLHDAIVCVLVLHEIEKESRDAVVKELARILKTGGKIFIKEFIRSGHGFQEHEIKELMAKAGLKEVESRIYKSMMMGKMYDGVFAKP